MFIQFRLNIKEKNTKSFIIDRIRAGFGIMDYALIGKTKGVIVDWKTG